MNETRHRVVRGNLGAQAVYLALLNRDYGDDIETLLRLDVTGAELWILYSNCCNEDIASLHTALQQGTAVELLRSQPDSKFYRVSTKGDEING